MSAPLRVAVADGSSAGFANTQAATWASLPMSITAAHENIQLVAVDGRSAAWPAITRAAVDSGAVGIMVVRPRVAASPPEVRALAEELVNRGVACVVESAWASHPAVADAHGAIVNRVSNCGLVDSLATITSDDDRTFDDVLFDHLAFVRAAWTPIRHLDFSVQHNHGYTVEAVQDSCVVVLSAVRSAGARGQVRFAAYAASGEVHLTVPDDGTAAPAAAWYIDADGKTSRPSWYESASRFAWQRLRDAVRASERTSDLLELADDLDVAALAEAT